MHRCRVREDVERFHDRLEVLVGDHPDRRDPVTGHENPLVSGDRLIDERREVLPRLGQRNCRHVQNSDYWLGGKDNYAADRAAAEAIIAVRPAIVRDIRANRDFMRRAAAFLAAQGVRQFLDIGTGIPTRPNLHEVVQEIAPDARIVYADNNPVVLAHARALLVSTPEGETAYLHADLRDTGTILKEAARTLDFTQPTAVMLVSILQLIRDEEDPYGIVAQLIEQGRAGQLPGAYPPGE